MRIFRYVFDLPWWIGLPIFLAGNLLVPLGFFQYISGLIVCMFGCWTFSKLLNYSEESEIGQAAFYIPMMVLSMWFLNEKYIDWEYNTLYVVRASSGLFCGILAFQGFRK